MALFKELNDSLVVDYGRNNEIKDMTIAQALANTFKRNRAN